MMRIRMWQRRKSHQVAGTLLLVMAGIANVFAQNPCGEIRMSSSGPWDYRSAPKQTLELVEGDHFTPIVESLASGQTTAYPGGDLDFTLRSFPNHPRALLAMMKLAAKEGDKPRGSRYSIQCWFERAIRFTPNDGHVRMLHGVFLLRKGQKEDAVSELETAGGLVKDDPNLHYNLGLAYFDLGNFDQSLSHAHKAYRLGFPLLGLKNKLARANKWREPAATE